MEDNFQVLSKEEIRRCRHKCEKRWYRRLVIINILIIISVISITICSGKENNEFINGLKTDFKTILTEGNTSKNNDKNIDIDDELEDIPLGLNYLILGIVSIIMLPFILSYFYAKFISMSVKVTRNNFPEVYDIVEEYSRRLELKKVPNVYIIQGNGILNAMASFIPFKQYVVLYADLIEVGYREHHDMASIRFILGHEMAHIKLKHSTLGYSIKILFANLVPIISSTASRAREYSCDRIAQKLSGSDGIDAMLALSVGKHLYKSVDVDDYIKEAKGIRGFFVWCNNLASDHPILPKRIQALKMKEGSGKLY